MDEIMYSVRVEVQRIAKRRSKEQRYNLQKVKETQEWALECDKFNVCIYGYNIDKVWFDCHKAVEEIIYEKLIQQFKDHL